MFEYQKYGRYFAQCPQTVEELLAKELEELGASEIRTAYRGVYFVGDSSVLYRANYCSRLATHILAPLITFQCHSDKYLYRTARKIDWPSIIRLEQTFVIAANASDSNVHHSEFAAQRLKDAIADQFVDRFGKRPSVDRRNADVHLSLNIFRNRAIISVDCSGGSLHRRGYRVAAREAPLQETLAATILRHTGWTGERPLVDPMCGSGTILAEAVMLASGTPPAYLRMAEQAPFACLPDFDVEKWNEVRSAADSAMREPSSHVVSGSDVDPKAVEVARGNLDRIPWGGDVSVERRDFRTRDAIDGATIVTNPPYGRRLGDRDKVKVLYRELGDYLKQRCTNCTAWILAGDVELVKSIGLRPKRRIPIFNGPLECRLVEVPIY